jgi:hypothetical protein
VESSETEATEALVIMCASIKGSWKLPIAYFFQDKCSAELQGELIQTALHLCDKSSLRVRTFTCDGTSTNWSSLRALGFLNNFDPENIQFELKYEYNGVEKTVYFTPDACHAAKLARNAIGNYFLVFYSTIFLTSFLLFLFSVTSFPCWCLIICFFLFLCYAEQPRINSFVLMTNT